ncbi:Lactadherin [Echinococcus granulosus]|nr:Lactadherin [Echinococcus granulosus]
MRGPPQPTHLLLLLALHCTQCTLQVRGATQPVMRMDKSATGGTFPYNPFYDACEQDDPLGMISGAITDAQISTSSYIEEGGWAISKCAPTNARPFLANGLAWCPKYKSSTEWLQIDLGVRATITGVLLQGRGDGDEWVASYTLSFSDDGVLWRFANDLYHNQRIFEGNIDSYQVKHTYLDEAVVTRFVRIYPFTWNRHPSLRVELIGCQPCRQLLGTPPYARYGASTTRSKKHGKTCTVEDGHYFSNKAWCAKRQNGMQWYQIDLGPPTLITGIVLRPRGDSKWQQYVTLFKLSYSNDSLLWFFYKDAAHLDQRVFTGNTQTLTERVHYLAATVVARYVRIHPISWRGRIAMRVGLLGCRQRGNCEPGFFRINNKSSCVPNLAYKKDAWMSNNPENPRRKSSSSPPVPYNSVPQNPQTPVYSFLPPTLPTPSQTTPTRSSAFFLDATPKPLSPTTPINDWSLHDVMLGDAGYVAKDEVAMRAVDGFTGLEEAREEGKPMGQQEKQLKDAYFRANSKRALRSVSAVEPQLHQCTILQYTWPFQETPSWYVDLQEPQEVQGIILYTGGHGKSEAYRKLIAQSLQGSSELVLRMNNLERVAVYVEGEYVPGGRQLCGHVTRLNDAVFAPKLHITCQRPTTGRYVIVEAYGLMATWPKDYLAALCEVQVY